MARHRDDRGDSFTARRVPVRRRINRPGFTIQLALSCQTCRENDAFKTLLRDAGREDLLDTGHGTSGAGIVIPSKGRPGAGPLTMMQ